MSANPTDAEYYNNVFEEEEEEEEQEQETNPFKKIDIIKMAKIDRKSVV